MGFKYVCGIDPDSEKHGVAIYEDGKLISLQNWELVEIFFHLGVRKNPSDYLFSIENVCANNFVYRQKQTDNGNTNMEKARCLGLVQQSQKEIERVLKFHGVEYQLHKPQSGNWAEKENVRQFELVTKWKKRSNKDNRSAAFFGFLALNGSKQQQLKL